MRKPSLELREHLVFPLKRTNIHRHARKQTQVWEQPWAVSTGAQILRQVIFMYIDRREGQTWGVVWSRWEREERMKLCKSGKWRGGSKMWTRTRQGGSSKEQTGHDDEGDIPKSSVMISIPSRGNSTKAWWHQHLKQQNQVILMESKQLAELLMQGEINLCKLFLSCLILVAPQSLDRVSKISK